MDKENLKILLKSGIIALFMLIFTYPTYSQNNEQVPVNTTIDTVDDENDLFDDNTNYKEMYKDLNKDGDWVTMKQSDLDDDSGESGENVNQEVTNVKIINVWRPRGMGPDWSPYSEGRWVYTYSGWVWSTDYDWGWAAYHYGRWFFYDLYGWVWLPGRYWSSCWVQWGYTSSYIGWYPMYPRRHGWHSHGHHGRHDRYYHGGHHNNWVYVNRNKFTEKIDKNIIVDKSKYPEIINGSKTKAIVKFDGKNMMNVGPKVTTVEKNTGQKIEPKQINYNGSKGITKVDDKTVTLYRNDISKKDKINSQNGSKNKNSYNGSKSKNKQNSEVNNGSRDKGNNGSKTKDNTGTKTKDNTGTKTKDNTGTRNKDYNGSKSKENNNSNEGTRNKENNGSKDNTRYKDSNTYNNNRESNNNRGNDSNRGNNGSRGNDSNRSGDSNRGGNNGNNGNRGGNEGSHRK